MSSITITKFSCDRCKKEIGPDYERSVMSIMMRYSESVYQRHGYVDFASGLHNVDLCDKCCEDFVSFWNKGLL